MAYTSKPANLAYWDFTNSKWVTSSSSDTRKLIPDITVHDGNGIISRVYIEITINSDKNVYLTYSTYGISSYYSTSAYNIHYPDSDYNYRLTDSSGTILYSYNLPYTCYYSSRTDNVSVAYVYSSESAFANAVNANGNLSTDNIVITDQSTSLVFIKKICVSRYYFYSKTNYGFENFRRLGNLSFTYTSPKYNLAYNANGGSGAPAAETDKIANCSYNLSSTVPTRTNHRFLGWSTSSTATTAEYAAGASFTNYITDNSSFGNVTLYAVWKVLASSISTSGTNQIGKAATDGVNLTIKQYSSTYGEYYHKIKATAYDSSDNVLFEHIFNSGLNFNTQTTTILWRADTEVNSHPSYYYIFNAYPSSTTCKMRFDVYTYEESAMTTLLGSNYLTVNVDFAASVKPTILSASDVLTDTISKPSGLSKFIRGKSKISYTAYVTPFDGSTLSKYLFSANGVNTEYTSSATNYTHLFNTGDRELTVTVTDSRGRTDAHTAYNASDWTSDDYFSPVITNFVATRCLSDGTLSDQGTYLKVTFDYEIDLLENTNSKYYQLAFHESSSSTWLDADTSTQTMTNHSLSSYTGSITYISPSAIMTDAYSFVIRLNLCDFFNSANYSYNTVSTSYAIIDIKSNGLGLGIGKTSETDYTVELQTGWSIKIGNTSLNESELIALKALLS